MTTGKIVEYVSKNLELITDDDSASVEIRIAALEQIAKDAEQKAKEVRARPAPEKSPKK